MATESVQEIVNALAAQNDVQGVIVADAQGLTLAAKGAAPSSAAAYLVSVVNKAGELGENPIVQIETEQSTVLVKKEQDTVTAIYKKGA